MLHFYVFCPSTWHQWLSIIHGYFPGNGQSFDCSDISDATPRNADISMTSFHKGLSTVTKQNNGKVNNVHLSEDRLNMKGLRIIICSSGLDIIFGNHYGDVIMGAIASRITSLTIVYSAVYSDRSKKTSKLRVTGFGVGNSPGTGEFPTQMASNTENVSIWWRHHDSCYCLQLTLKCWVVLMKHIHMFISSIISRQCYGVCCLSHTSWKPRTHLSYIVNTTSVDNLALSHVSGCYCPCSPDIFLIQYQEDLCRTIFCSILNYHCMNCIKFVHSIITHHRACLTFLTRQLIHVTSSSYWNPLRGVFT